MGEDERERGEHDRAGEREAEREAERAAGRVDAGGLADAFLVDRRERVVVELRDEQAEARAGDHRAGSTIAQPESARGTIGISTATPTTSSGKPARMILLGLRLPAVFPASSATANMRERERRERQPGLHRVVLEHHLQEDRQGDHQAAERDLLQRLRRDAEPEVLRAKEAGVDERGLSLALALAQPPGERAERDDADGDQRAHRLAALLPDEDAEHDAAHAERGEDRADDVDAAGRRCTGRP